MVDKVQERMLKCIAEIKRIWQPGMTAKQISDAVDPKLFVTRGSTIKQPSRNTIIGMFSRHREALQPCELNPGPNIKGTNKPPADSKQEAMRKQADAQSNQPEKARLEAQAALKAVAEAHERVPLTAEEKQVKRFDIDRRQFEREPIYKAQKTMAKSTITLATFSWDKTNGKGSGHSQVGQEEHEEKERPKKGRPNKPQRSKLYENNSPD